jgi:hypothetical protein
MGGPTAYQNAHREMADVGNAIGLRKKLLFLRNNKKRLDFFGNSKVMDTLYDPCLGIAPQCEKPVKTSGLDMSYAHIASIV